MEKTAIIIPAYNEEKRIGKTLEGYSKFFNKLKHDRVMDYELLVVINNTTDNTLGLVKKAIKKNKNIKYLDLLKGGKGYAVIEGFRHYLEKDFGLIGFVDADMATSPEEYWKLVDFLGKNKNIHGAIADRYLNDSKIYPRPSVKRLIARKAFNMLIRGILLLPFGDTQCGAKVFKKKAITESIQKLSMSQWAFDVELLYHLRKSGFKIKSLPTIWIDKEYSKINFWRAGPWMALGVVRLRLLNSPLKSMMRIYDKIIKYIPKP